MAYDKKSAAGAPKTARVPNSPHILVSAAARIKVVLYRVAPWLSASGVFNA